MQRIRRISQIVFLFLYFLFFILASYPLIHSVPVDVFLRMDPLAMATSSIAQRFFLIKFLPAVIVILMTIFFGRFFCGWICPLGTSIDAFDKGVKAKPNNKKFKGANSIKFFLFFTVLFAALFSGQIAGWIDPIPLFTRVTTTVFYPLFVFILDGFFGLLYTIPFLEDAVFSIEDSLRGNLLPVIPSLLKGILINGLIITIILGLAVFQKRFWCRNLCPLGGMLGLFSKFRWYRREVSDACTQCGICAAKCRTGAIQKDFKATNHPECINCMDCVKDCPENAIKFKFASKPAKSKADTSRRQFISAGIAGLLSVGVLKKNLLSVVKRGKVIRPPGALEEDAFLDRCIRCGECVRVCSTSGKGLHLSGLEAGLEGLGSPILMPPDGYCEYNCNLCGQVCPTEAIQPLNIEEKHQAKMGTAHFDKTRCIPWYYGENCLVCEEHCPVSEKAIKFVEKTVESIDGKKNTILLPYVDEAACVGCGICASVCPLEAEKGIFVTTAGEIRSYV